MSQKNLRSFFLSLKKVESEKFKFDEKG